MSGARGSAEILNIARSARTPVNFKVSNALKIDFVSQICCSQDFAEIMIFHEILDFLVGKNVEVVGCFAMKTPQPTLILSENKTRRQKILIERKIS